MAMTCVAWALLALLALLAIGAQAGKKCSLYQENACATVRGKAQACEFPKSCTTKAKINTCKPRCKKQTPEQMKSVTFGSGLPGWEKGAKKKPAVIVLQEWWGVNNEIKELASHIAAQGYRVFIPDLYKGKVATTVTDAIQLSSQLNFTLASSEMAQAATYLKSTGSPRVAVIGFCQGGSLALCAAQSADVVAAAPFYGLPRGGCDPTKIKIPVQGHWGANDTSSKPEDAEKAFKLMKDAGVNAQLFTDYKDSPHAFMNAIGPKGRELTKARGSKLAPETEVIKAFARLTQFLKTHLKKKK